MGSQGSRRRRHWGSRSAVQLHRLLRTTRQAAAADLGPAVLQAPLRHSLHTSQIQWDQLVVCAGSGSICTDDRWQLSRCRHQLLTQTHLSMTKSSIPGHQYNASRMLPRKRHAPPYKRLGHPVAEPWQQPHTTFLLPHDIAWHCRASRPQTAMSSLYLKYQDIVSDIPINKSTRCRVLGHETKGIQGNVCPLVEVEVTTYDLRIIETFLATKWHAIQR